MGIEGKCQNVSCKNRAEFACEENYHHRHCTNCIQIHRKTQHNNIIPFNQLIVEQDFFLLEVQILFNEVKSNLLNASIKTISILMDFTRNHLEQTYDLKNFNSIKKRFNEINISLSNQAPFEITSKYINESFFIMIVNLI